MRDALSKIKVWNQTSPELFQKHLEFLYFFAIYSSPACLYLLDVLKVQLQKQHYHPGSLLQINCLCAAIPSCKPQEAAPLPLRKQEPWVVHANRWTSPDCLIDTWKISLQQLVSPRLQKLKIAAVNEQKDKLCRGKKSHSKSGEKTEQELPNHVK